MNIKLEKFEGPLSLMLKLIEKEEMDITQISLAKIADQYVEYIKNTESINPEEMADFLLMAAKLLLAKSKALLPYLYPEEEEDLQELEKQLKMYKEYIEATKKVEKMIGKKKFMFQREFNRKVVLVGVSDFSPPKKLQAEDMRMVFEGLLVRLKPSEKLGKRTIEDHKISIDDKICSIKGMILKRIKFSFSKLLADSSNKTEVIVSFLAALELMRQREVRLEQEVMFGEIVLRKW